LFSLPKIRCLAPHDGRRATRAVLVAIAAMTLAACASTPGEENAKVATSAESKNAFAVPDWVKAGSERKTIVSARTVGPDDLIGTDGSCAATRIAAAPPTSESDAGSSNPAAMAAAQPGPTVAGGIALAMTECEVAQRAGYPGNVEVGSEAGGERSAVLTYREGPWPGIYRFRGGRLVSIERVEVIEPPKPKKPAKPAKPAPRRANQQS
jgi:hypothetical protein